MSYAANPNISRIMRDHNISFNEAKRVWLATERLKTAIAKKRANNV